MTRLEKLKSLCADNAVRPHGAIVLEPNELAALLALVEQQETALKYAKRILDQSGILVSDNFSQIHEALTVFAAWNENKEDVK